MTTTMHSVNTPSTYNNDIANSETKDCFAANKFASAFYKKANVKLVLRSNTVIGQLEAKMMLTYFRNVEVENIESNGIIPQVGPVDFVDELPQK